MINELMKVADAIKDLPGVADGAPDCLQPLPKASATSPCIRIWLTSKGAIDSIEKLTPEHVAQLRKFAKNKFCSLPGFNITALAGLPDDDIQKEAKKTLEGLKRNFTIARKELLKRCGDQLDANETLNKLFSVVGKLNPEQFLDAFNDEILGNNWGWRATPGKKLSVFLDVKDYEKYPVAHPETIKRLNFLLSPPKLALVKNEAKDAYDSAAIGVDELFNDITVPRLLGQIKIRSLNKDIPAQQRYGHVGSMTFPVGNDSRQLTTAALGWISALENEGSTFGIAGDKELLFAYPASMPQSKTPLARMLGAQNDAELAKERFGKLAKSVIDQLKGFAANVNNADLEIFALRKMDKARTKVVYYRNISVATLEASCQAWDEGCRNIPQIDLVEWPRVEKRRLKNPEKAAAPTLVEQTTVFPIKLHRYLNIAWTRDLRQSKVRLFAPGDGLSLLFNAVPEALAKSILERFLQHSHSYFRELCACQGKQMFSQAPDKAIYPGILGLLLYKQGQRKERYMKETAFLLGRSLRIADEIHRLYCEKVRDNQFPPELCGSSLLTAMQESPTATLAQLCQRSAPYVKWARAYQKEDAGLVHFWLNKWEPVADALHGLTLPQRLGVPDRAEVFLGYLASFPKKEQASTPDSPQIGETKQGV